MIDSHFIKAMNGVIRGEMSRRITYQQREIMTANTSDYVSLNDFFSERIATFRDKPAITCLGHTLSYGDVDAYANNFAAYLQNNLSLQPGDKIAIQLPNLLQYPMVVIAAMKAGLVIVNTNPLYTEREMLHQFTDAAVKAVVVLTDFASKVAAVQKNTAIEHVIVSDVADLLPPLKRCVIHSVLRLKRLFNRQPKVESAITLLAALSLGKNSTVKLVNRKSGDIALLQYTGGTTGVSKGAMLTHANLLSNIGQVEAALGDALIEGEEIMVAPLPIYHIFAFMLCMLLGVGTGARVILIPDPRDGKGFIRALKGVPFTFFAGLNTLFNALCRNNSFSDLDFLQLRITVSGGMALTRDTAERWEEVTGCKIIEGYGLTESSPVVSFNPIKAPKLGTVGKLVPNTEARLLDADGLQVQKGERGELWVRGPQVMRGYWQQPDATLEVLDNEGWLHTGDVAIEDSEGYLSIVDRIKDMIVVSGFNVYPNELEDEISKHPDILECAAIGVPDSDSVEAVKLFVVAANTSLSVEDVKIFAGKNLTGYKVPRYIEFIKELPKSNVGKVLRRKLRDV